MRKILKFILYLIIAIICLFILLIAYWKYEELKNPAPTSEERKIIEENQSNIKERNERLYTCLRDNKETSLKLKNTECEVYADGGKVDFNDDSGKKDIIKNLKSKEYAERYDNYDQRYWKCYGEMTNAHKARGFHQSNRNASINVKEAVCSAYAKGEELNYEGKR